MSRSSHPGLVVGALAALSFFAGVAIEPMFERSAAADIPARAGKPAIRGPAIPGKGSAKTTAIQVAPANTAPAATPLALVPAPEAATTPEPPAPVEAAASTAEAGPTVESGIDPDKQVEYFEMKNMPAEDGQGGAAQGGAAQDVNMIDEPGYAIPEDTTAQPTAETTAPPPQEAPAEAVQN